MARKPQKRLSAEERKAQIVDAALQLFAQKGFSGTRTKEIAKQAGISEALIFQHFKTKERLYNEALKETFKDHPMVPDIISPMENKDDRGVLTAYAEHMIKHGMQDERMFRLIIYSGLEGVHLETHAGPHHQTGEEQNWEPADTALVEYFSQRVEAGAFKDFNPEAMVRHFRNAVAMYVVDRILPIDPTPFPASREEAVELLVGIFLDGIRN